MVQNSLVISCLVVYTTQYHAQNTGPRLHEFIPGVCEAILRIDAPLLDGAEMAGGQGH
jgi:hypothetical protein